MFLDAVTKTNKGILRMGEFVLLQIKEGRKLVMAGMVAGVGYCIYNQDAERDKCG